jgi:hypothetical protein
MTRDEITAMARNCGWAKVGREMEYPVLTARLERFAALVAAAERETCAKVCEDARSLPDVGPLYCAVAIRARGNT